MPRPPASKAYIRLVQLVETKKTGLEMERERGEK